MPQYQIEYTLVVVIEASNKDEAEREAQPIAAAVVCPEGPAIYCEVDLDPLQIFELDENGDPVEM